jgi:hypothetical protein
MGSVNLITPAKRKQAAALVRDGVSVSLARDTDKTEFGRQPVTVRSLNECDRR